MIHPTAVVDEGAHVSSDAAVWHFVHVCPGARIEDGVSLGQGVYVGPNVTIRRGTRVQNHVSLYEGVELAEDVFVGPSAVFTNIKTPRAFVSRRNELVVTRVETGASIGANATVVCGVTIGRFAMVGAGAVVIRDVAPHALVIGTPARPIGWVCRCGLRLSEGLTCGCGRRYMLTDELREA